MTQAIVTRFIGPTNTRGARIKATAWGGSVTVPFYYELGVQGAHDAAAEALVRKMGWQGAWVSGGSPDERGFCYVNARNEPPAFVI